LFIHQSIIIVKKEIGGEKQWQAEATDQVAEATL
jgi:hypothetical protein